MAAESVCLFQAIKLVILFTFWQEIALSVLIWFGVVSWEPLYNSRYAAELVRHNPGGHCHPWCAGGTDPVPPAKTAQHTH